MDIIIKSGDIVKKYGLYYECNEKGEAIDKTSKINLIAGNVAPENKSGYWILQENNLSELDISKSIINQQDVTGDTPLHVALKNNNYDTVNMLLNFPNIDINAQNQQGNTPLHLAIMKNNNNAIEILLSKKADINVKNNNQDNALYTAIDYSNVKAVEKLVSLYEIKNENIIYSISKIQQEQTEYNSYCNTIIDEFNEKIEKIKKEQRESKVRPESLLFAMQAFTTSINNSGYREQIKELENQKNKIMSNTYEDIDIIKFKKNINNANNIALILLEHNKENISNYVNDKKQNILHIAIEAKCNQEVINFIIEKLASSNN